MAGVRSDESAVKNLTESGSYPSSESALAAFYGTDAFAFAPEAPNAQGLAACFRCKCEPDRYLGPIVDCAFAGTGKVSNRDFDPIGDEFPDRFPSGIEEIRMPNTGTWASG